MSLDHKMVLDHNLLGNKTFLGYKMVLNHKMLNIGVSRKYLDSLESLEIIGMEPLESSSLMEDILESLEIITMEPLVGLLSWAFSPCLS